MKRNIPNSCIDKDTIVERDIVHSEDIRETSNVKENEQLSLAEYFDIDEHTPANSTSVHTIEYPVFNFDSIFEDKRLKEVHNQHSFTNPTASREEYGNTLL